MKDNYDPEEHQKNDFKGFQHSLRARWHGRDKMLHLVYYKILQVSRLERCSVNRQPLYDAY